MPRKKPFSSKQKKFQLQDKRRRKKEPGYTDYGEEGEEVVEEEEVKQQVNQQPATAGNKYDPNRYRLHFFKERDVEIQRRKALAYKPLRSVPEEDLEVDVDLVYQPGTALDQPKRPVWDYSLSKHKLEEHETKYFQGYLDKIFEKYSPENLSYFEMNLETWRQLWRVLEMCDVMLLILDIRYPVLHFSPALYNHVTHDLGKSIIVVLNKIDLAPPPLVVAWKHFLEQRYPKVNIVYFTSFPKEALAENDEKKAKQRRMRRGRGGGWVTAMGPRQLYDVCQDIVKEKVDLSNWLYKITVGEASSCDEDCTDHSEASHVNTEPDPGRESFKDGILTIGCVGYPNVGKSSLLNGLVGRKVVSVSRTPGHTKHFQTIFLTPTVKLCDCPGLVFPSLVEKPLQILAGIYPIAQVREPYTPIGFLAERVDVIKQLKLTHPCDEGEASASSVWSAMDICQAWAEKRKFITAKTARADVYRAANNLLRMALDGRLCLCLRPPGYLGKIEYWKSHPDTKKLLEDLKKYAVGDDTDESEDEEPDDSEEEFIEKEEDEEEESSEEEKDKDGSKEKFVSSNPYALLMDDD